MGNLPHITESEWAIMSALWEESPLTGAQIVQRIQVEKDLANTTVRTLLRRLVAKHAVGSKVDASNQKLYYYYPLVQEQDCVVKESKQFLSLYFKDNVEKLFATFVDNTELSDQEIESLKEILEKKKNNACE